MLPVLAYLGYQKVTSYDDVNDYCARIEGSWKSFYDLDVKPFVKDVDSGAVLKQVYGLSDSSVIGDVLGTPEEMKKLKPFVDLRNKLVKDRARFLELRDALSALTGKPTVESAMGSLKAMEDLYKEDRSLLGQVRKLLSPEPGNLRTPGLPTGEEALVYAGGATVFGLLVYGIYRLIRRSTARQEESWK